MPTNLYLYAADEPCFAGTAKGFVAEDPKNHAVEPVQSPGDIVKALKKYSDVSWVFFDAHGVPGQIHLPLANFSSANAPLLSPCSSALTADARVLFLGCKVADGPDGRTFLFEVGKALLTGNGGIIGGSTVDTHVACIEIASFFTDTFTFEGPRKGILRLIQFNQGGNAIKEATVSHDWFRRPIKVTTSP
jgi:hypothetical protein